MEVFSELTVGACSPSNNDQMGLDGARWEIFFGGWRGFQMGRNGARWGAIFFFLAVDGVFRWGGMGRALNFFCWLVEFSDGVQWARWGFFVGRSGGFQVGRDGA